MDGAFTAGDSIDGGAGNDTVILDGDYSTNVKLRVTTLTRVETLVLNGGFHNVITTVNGTVAAGKALTVDASGLWGSLTFNGGAEKDGRFVMTGSSADDNLTGGSKNDTIAGNAGADVLTGGAGADKFVYSQSWDSTSSGYDRIVGFDAAHDKIDLWMTVSGVTTLSHGTLNAASLAAGLQTALSGLAASGAVIFTPDHGDLAGKTFVVVESFGNSGYTDGDLIIQLGKPVSTALTIDTFI
jgi:Ca2+-binding RTX toxin-like protein